MGEHHRCVRRRMRLFFANRHLEQRCILERAGDTAWGVHATVIRRRLMQLDAAPHLSELLDFPPGLRPTPRGLDRPAEFFVPAGSVMHIRVTAVHSDGSTLNGAALDPREITALRVLAVEEIHGR